MSNYILPEKWCIKVTPESKEALIKWRTAGKGLCTDTGYCSRNDGYWTSNFPVDCTEITFDQFKELVLKKNNMDKKLIGYNLKKDCTQFEQASFAIINVHSKEGNTKFTNKNGVNFTEDSLYHDWLKEANVLDLWFEPVFESIKKDVQVPVKASKQLVFTISKDHEGYVKENHENKKVSIQSLADMVNYGFGLHGYSAYKIKPVTFDMGCVKNICTSGIEKVIEAYDEFWGTSHLELPF